MNDLRRSYVIPLVVLGTVYVAFVLYPFAETIKQSLSAGEGFNLSTYVDLLSLHNTGNIEAVWNSVLVSMLSVLFSGILGVFLAFVFTQCDFPFSKLLSRLAVLPIALPPLVGVIAFLFVFGEGGLLPRLAKVTFGLHGSPPSLDGISAIVAVHSYSFYVYFYLFVSTALRNLDASQLEAARSFGSTTTRTIWKVILPGLRPALLGASVLTFMSSMASFSAPLLFGGEKRFMTVQIYYAKLNGELNVASAQAVGLTLVSVLFFVFLQYITPQRSAVRGSKGAGKTGMIPLSLRVTRVLKWLCAMFMVIELLPVLMIVVISFAREGSWTSQILPVSYTWENYVKLLASSHVFEPIVNSAAMSLLTVAACILFGVAVAYLLTKGVLRRMRFFGEIAATVSFAIPGTVIAIGLILAFNKPTVFTAGSVLVGTFWILPLAYFVRMFPMVVRSTSASFEQLDDALLEAGQTFGAGMWRRFRLIILPLILPGIVSGALLVMITALGEFVSSVLLYTYSSRPISVEILAQMRTYNFGAAAAYSVFLLILIMLLSVLSGYFGNKLETQGAGLNA